MAPLSWLLTVIRMKRCAANLRRTLPNITVAN
ncbi:Uncharacterised protein [Vibrio cholerae]|nr:Uncharacterised protein [Vibrio cholerae]